MTPKRIFALIMGIVAALRGIGYIWPEGVPAGLQTLSLVPAGLVTWGWIWFIAGAIAIIGAFTKHSSVPLIPFVMVNFLWGGSYLLEWLSVIITWDRWIPTFSGDISRDWITTLSYFALAVATLVVIRLVDPSEVKANKRERHE